VIERSPTGGFFFLRPHPIPLEIPVPFAGQGVVQIFCATALLTHTPNSELTAMLLSGTASDPTVGIMQQTVG